MSAVDVKKVYIAPKAKIWVADPTAAATKLPTDLVTPLDPATFKELGYTDDTGIELIPTVNTNPITAHQSATPLKYVLKDAALQLKFVCMQWDVDTVALYFGATLTTAGSVTSLSIASTPLLAEKTLVVEWGDYVQDDTATPATLTGHKSRLVVNRGMVSSRDNIKLTRVDVQSLGITFDALDSNGTLATILTNSGS